MDILKNLDKITERITELESIKQAAKDFVKLLNKDGTLTVTRYNNADKRLEALLAFQHLRSLLKGKD